jgi:hypothetical protein
MADIRRIEDETASELKKVNYFKLGIFKLFKEFILFYKTKEIAKGEIKGYAADGDAE